MIVRTPFPSIRLSIAMKPGRLSTGSPPLTAAVIELVHDLDPGPPSEPLNGLALSPVAVPGNGGASVPAVSSSPRSNARSGATASKLTPNDEGNRVREAQAAPGASRRIPPSPADGQKGPTVPGNGGASVPAVSVADGTVIARDEAHEGGRKSVGTRSLKSGLPTPRSRLDASF